MLKTFLRLFESKKARNIRLARERAALRSVGRQAEQLAQVRALQDRQDMRHGQNAWVDSIQK